MVSLKDLFTNTIAVSLEDDVITEGLVFVIADGYHAGDRLTLSTASLQGLSQWLDSAHILYVPDATPDQALDIVRSISLEGKVALDERFVGLYHVDSMGHAEYLKEYTVFPSMPLDPTLSFASIPSLDSFSLTSLVNAPSPVDVNTISPMILESSDVNFMLAPSFVFDTHPAIAQDDLALFLSDSQAISQLAIFPSAVDTHMLDSILSYVTAHDAHISYDHHALLEIVLHDDAYMEKTIAFADIHLPSDMDLTLPNVFRFIKG